MLSRPAAVSKIAPKGFPSFSAPVPVAGRDPGEMLKRLLWVYFFVWLMEGALRFWVLPGLKQPLLIVRDPLVILIYIVAIQRRVFTLNQVSFGAILITCLALLSTMGLGGHGNWGVALFGFRTNCLHFPLIFLIPRIFDRGDVVKLGRVCLILMLPMAVLSVYQFSQPPESWVNEGGFRTHYSTVRPSGTFSFVSGLVCFTSMVASFLAAGFAMDKLYSRNLLFASAAAVMASLVVSGSRTTVFSVAIVFVILVVFLFLRGRGLTNLAVLVGVVGLAFSSMSSAEFFQEGQEQLVKRFQDAGQGKALGDVQGRLMEMFTEAFRLSDDVPTLGAGLGLGTNAGSALMTGKRQFLGGESDWTRLIFEMGPIMGFSFIGLRLAVVVLLYRATTKAVVEGNFLGVLLFGASAVPVLIGQWGVPTIQGFASLAAGLTLAACRTPPPSAPEEPAPEGWRKSNRQPPGTPAFRVKPQPPAPLAPVKPPGWVGPGAAGRPPRNRGAGRDE